MSRLLPAWIVAMLITGWQAVEAYSVLSSKLQLNPQEYLAGGIAGLVVGVISFCWAVDAKLHFFLLNGSVIVTILPLSLIQIVLVFTD